MVDTIVKPNKIRSDSVLGDFYFKSICGQPYFHICTLEGPNLNKSVVVERLPCVEQPYHEVVGRDEGKTLVIQIVEVEHVIANRQRYGRS